MMEMGRRDLLAGAVTLALWPARARAQSSAPPVVGFLGSETPEQWSRRVLAFKEGLARAGFVEGQNVSFVFRWAEGRNERLPALAAELAAMKVSVIAVLGSTVSAFAAKNATSTIPIVVRMAVEPTSVGLVQSLARPGGNLTGWTTLGATIGPKQIELLKDLLPAGATVGLLVNPTNPYLSDLQQKLVPAAVRSFGYQPVLAMASTYAELRAAFEELENAGAKLVVIGADTFLNSQSARVAELAISHRIPSVSAYREFALEGGLMSYGGSVTEASRLVGEYAGRILKGEKPGELPVQQVDKLDLVVNMKTAGALGLSLPQLLVARADEVIE